jgi:hypothetical protein
MQYAHTHVHEHITGFSYICGRAHEHTKIRYTHKHVHSFTKIMQYAYVSSVNTVNEVYSRLPESPEV